MNKMIDHQPVANGNGVTPDAVPTEEQPRMHTVMLAAPSYDGTITAWHAASLAETCKIGLANNINVLPIYMSYDALVQRARNDIFQLAFEAEVDDLVFIDADQDWNPMDFFKLLSYDVSVVGAPVIKKGAPEAYNVKALKPIVFDETTGLGEVDSVGTGFMRIRKDAIKTLWNLSNEYKEPHKEVPSRMVFEVGLVNGELWSEDVLFCGRWKATGGKVYIDPSINPGHTGDNRWVGNFAQWYKTLEK